MRLRVPVLVALVTFSLCLASPAANANYFGLSGGDGCCRFADNKEHTFHFAIVPNQSYRDAMNHIFNHLDNGTVMTTKKVDNTSATDVVFIAESMGPATLSGKYQCQSVNGAGECEKAKVWLNRAGLDGEGQHAKDHTACHEVGHSVGLSHAYQLSSCMEQEKVSLSTSGITTRTICGIDGDSRGS
jgi:hypothetical protein